MLLFGWGVLLQTVMAMYSFTQYKGMGSTVHIKVVPWLWIIRNTVCTANIQ